MHRLDFAIKAGSHLMSEIEMVDAYADKVYELTKTKAMNNGYHELEAHEEACEAAERIIATHQVVH